MATILGGYDTNEESSQDSLSRVTVTKADTKTKLDVNVEGLVAISEGVIYTVPPATFSGAYSGNQSSVTLITPTSGKKIQVIGCLVTGDGSLFDCKIWFSTSTKIVQQHFEQGTLGSYIPLNVTGAEDEVLTLDITDAAGQNWFIIVNYAEVDA